MVRVRVRVRVGVRVRVSDQALEDPGVPALKVREGQAVARVDDDEEEQGGG